MSQDVVVPPELMSPYDAIGGEPAVRQLVERFYDAMDRDEPALSRLHRCDEAGHVHRESRDRFLAYRERCGDEDCVAQAYVDRIDEIADIAGF